MAHYTDFSSMKAVDTSFKQLVQHNDLKPGFDKFECYHRLRKYNRKEVGEGSGRSIAVCCGGEVRVVDRRGGYCFEERFGFSRSKGCYFVGNFVEAEG